ncbi:hypothetical protein [Corynebacterium sp. sy039]|uniref:hypothetical protein n=1 Tax=Corynebacterium sp. sy039 TaxID=2599641 RepID=UPI0011B78CD4|nr:hypothetical protein [Corynebacterium sp. sy039]QDZ42749.1 hypothetical protein FQV43_05960 [Corynebacterium sp. sy039]
MSLIYSTSSRASKKKSAIVPAAATWNGGNPFGPKAGKSSVRTLSPNCLVPRGMTQVSGKQERTIPPSVDSSYPRIAVTVASEGNKYDKRLNIFLGSLFGVTLTLGMFLSQTLNNDSVSPSSPQEKYSIYGVQQK